MGVRKVGPPKISSSRQVEEENPQGRADDLASTLLLATDTPVLLAPAMNVRMWTHAATRRNRAVLEGDGIGFVGPEDLLMITHALGHSICPTPPSLPPRVPPALSPLRERSQRLVPRLHEAHQGRASRRKVLRCWPGAPAPCRYSMSPSLGEYVARGFAMRAGGRGDRHRRH